jgi:3-phenylpropionate/trans-cinnamate dioxygenase ferredoxin component
MPAPRTDEAVVVSVDGIEVAVVGTDAGLVAFDDTCTHRACPLSEGQIEDGTVVCPCHKSRFHLTTGQPLNGPATEPIRIRRVEHDGRTLRVER